MKEHNYFNPSHGIISEYSLAEPSEAVYNWPQSSTTTFLEVFPLSLPYFSIVFTTSIPSTTLPNTTCLPSNLHRGCTHYDKPPPTPSLSLPGGLRSADEELGTVGVGSSISHGENSFTSVLQLKVLISKPAVKHILIAAHTPPHQGSI